MLILSSKNASSTYPRSHTGPQRIGPTRVKLGYLGHLRGHVFGCQALEDDVIRLAANERVEESGRLDLGGLGDDTDRFKADRSRIGSVDIGWGIDLRGLLRNT